MSKRVGSIYKLKYPLLGNQMDTKGLVFHDYEAGISVIFPNGELDGFSNNEIDRFLEYVGEEPLMVDYRFTSIIRTHDQFSNGYFDEFFLNCLKK